MGITQSFFKLGPPNLAWLFTLTSCKNWQKKFKRGVAPRGRGTYEYTLKLAYLSHFCPQEFQFFVVVDIEVMDKLGKIFKRGVVPRGRGTCEYTTKWA